MEAIIGNETPTVPTGSISLSADARAILESMGDAFYALDRDWCIVYANRRALEFWGLSAEQVVGHSVWERLPQLIGTINEDVLRQVRTEQRTITFEAPSPVTGIWVSVSVGPSGDGVTVFWRDITERVRAEQELRANEEHLRLAQEASGIGTWDYDPRSGALTWSDACKELFGLTPDAAFDDRAFRALLHPEDRDLPEQAARDALDPAGSGEVECEYRIIDAQTGKERWLQAKGRALFQHGRAVRLIGTLTDITDRKIAETQQRRSAETLEREVAERTRALAETVAELRRSRERYSAIFEHAPVDLAFMAVQPDGRIVCENANPSLLRHQGFSRQQLVGKSLEEFLTPEQVSYARMHYQQVIDTGQPLEFEYSARFPVGEVWRRTFLVPLRGPSGRVEHVLLTSVDLTEMRQIEAQLRQAQKMEAIGQLTGGIAHDFNNLLTVVIGNLELLERRVTDERTRGYVESAMRGAIRGGHLTQQLLAYARRQNLSPRPVDVNAVVNGMGELLQRSLGGLVKVEHDLAPELWWATSDPTQLELVILNLAINSRDAMPMGGRICIVTRNVVGGDDIPGELKPGEYVRIAVSDTGTGMPAHIVERAFEPFFTTKDVGKGSGLGLAQVYGVATQFGGTVRIVSEPEAGTTVAVFLPRAGMPAPAAVSDESGVAPAVGGSGVVLVVDDDPDIREIASTFLTEAGYVVKQAGSGPEALAALADEPVSLALVDYAMPVMSGYEVVRLARQVRPELLVVYVTGAADTLAPGQTQPRDPVLVKPYTRAALLAIVRDLL
jgi:PAS domain S-box-containing protein